MIMVHLAYFASEFIIMQSSQPKKFWTRRDNKIGVWIKDDNLLFSI